VIGLGLTRYVLGLEPLAAATWTGWSPPSARR